MKSAYNKASFNCVSPVPKVKEIRVQFSQVMTFSSYETRNKWSLLFAINVKCVETTNTFQVRKQELYFFETILKLNSNV